jgi:hypothetical protein
MLYVVTFVSDMLDFLHRIKLKNFEKLWSEIQQVFFN